ncbi:MAG: Uma2 family endonuclease [Saprospiraceae bacterium]
MEAVAAKPVAKKQKSREIPEALVYEIVDGKPVYYKGYRDVLSGKTNLESAMSESSLQAWLKARLSFLLYSALEEHGYDILTGELGLLLGEGTQRGADVSVYKSADLVLSAHYATLPPELIIEIDVQADMEDHSEMDYILRKIDDYLRFGVKKVVWVFTSNRKIMIAAPGQPWLTVDWSAEVDLLGGVSICLENVLAGKTVSLK